MLKKLTSRWPTPLAIAVLAGLYFCAGTLGLSLAFVNPSASLVWPASGIALAAILLWGYRLWPGIFLGAFLVNITTQGTLATAIGIATGNTLEAVLGAWMVFRFANGPKAFDQAGNIFKFILCGTILNTAVGALFGVTCLSLGGFAQWQDFLTIWLTWWLGDTIGALIVSPLLVIWITQPWPSLKPARILEAIGLLLMLILIGRIVFLGRILAGLEYLAVPPLLWAAFRFGQRGAATSTFLMSVMAVVGSLKGLGPFAAAEPNQALLLLLVFMGTITATGLVLGAVIAERRRTEQRLIVQDAVSRILAESPELRHATPKLVQVLCERAGWDIGAIWDIDRGGNHLECVELWRSAAVSAPEFEALTRQHKFSRGIGLPGRVWSSGQPAWVPDVTQDSNFPRAPAAAMAGLHAAFCFPFKFGDEILGVIECFSREVRQPDDHFLQMLPAIGSQLGQFIERRRAEEARQHSEALKGAILESALDCIISIDQEGKVIEFNPAAEKTFGYARAKVLGMPLAELIIPPHLREDHYRGLARYFDTGHGAVLGRRVEMPARRADGTELSVELAINAVQLGPDRIFTAYLRDITLRKQAEQALRASEQRFQAIIDNSTAIIYLKDLEGRYILINRRYEELFSIPKQEIITKRDFDIFPQEAARRFRENDLRVIETGAPVEFEEAVPHRDGTRIYISIKFPLRDTAGKTYAVAGISTDITERKRAEEQIRNLNAELQRRIDEFQTLIDTAPVGIAVATDPGCNNIWGNPEFARILGTDVRENISKSKPDGDTLGFRIFHEGRELPAGDLPMQRACREGIEIL
ncbi:MAG TPA: MASE1 domain-containing protein, partial [Candidatus Binatia bacterium]|nr:MASE1 domain-containing protein [Candidatus Binatia bacterium]